MRGDDRQQAAIFSYCKGMAGSAARRLCPNATGSGHRLAFTSCPRASTC
jgi:hypothetical protein